MSRAALGLPHPRGSFCGPCSDKTPGAVELRVADPQPLATLLGRNLAMDMAMDSVNEVILMANSMVFQVFLKPPAISSHPWQLATILSG